jgi:hypothetical protein
VPGTQRRALLASRALLREISQPSVHVPSEGEGENHPDCHRRAVAPGRSVSVRLRGLEGKGREGLVVRPQDARSAHAALFIDLSLDAGEGFPGSLRGRGLRPRRMHELGRRHPRRKPLTELGAVVEQRPICRCRRDTRARTLPRGRRWKPRARIGPGHEPSQRVDPGV